MPELEYRVVSSPSRTQMGINVTELLAAGWSLQGGVSIAYAPGGGELYAQAMVREK